jgi:glucose/arabinose dehydrogenase
MSKAGNPGGKDEGVKQVISIRIVPEIRLKTQVFLRMSFARDMKIMRPLLIVLLLLSLPLSARAENLPEPYATKSKTKFSNVIGWPEGKTPIAPEGFSVTKFSDGFDNPRNIFVAPNGDVFVSEGATKVGALKKFGAKLIGADKAQNLDGGGNRIILLRDTDNDGTPDVKSVFLDGLNQPFGMTIIDSSFFVANTDGLWKYEYHRGDLKPTGKGEKILSLPAGGYNNHWTRNLLASPDRSRLYISVGSGSNVGEHGMDNEIRRANILEVLPDGSGEKIYASGLRNPVGMDFVPGTYNLWTAVNERDELGDDLVPDYMTHVKEGGFYGWPYSYFGQNLDPQVKDQRPDLVKTALVPDMPLGAHTASLGLVFYDGKAFPVKYQGGAFIGQHGSWNRSSFAGYKVIFIPFKNGRPSGKPEDFLTGFIVDADKGDVYGRPVGVAVGVDGALLVADDAANTVWRVAPNKTGIKQ